MVTPDEEHDKFLKDPRTLCKYGQQCYQKNPQHLQKFKHPPKKQQTSTEKACNATKKRKLSVDTGRQLNVNGQKDTASTKQDEVSESVQTKTTLEGKPLNYMSDSGSEECTEEYPIDEKLSNKFDSMASTSTNTLTGNCSENEDVTTEAETNNHPQLKKRTKIDPEAFIKDKFLVNMPPDFYAFWDYCATIKPDKPSEAFANFGLYLVGPYDVCAGKFSEHVDMPPENYLIHWRYFYDPPEFQTVIRGSDTTGYHIGYFRDDPDELPVFVGNNLASSNGEISTMGDNIFAAVGKFLEATLKTCDPFKKMSLTKVLSQLKAKAAELKLSLSESSDKIKERNRKVLSRTFNKAGLVVPYNKKSQLGYRNLYMSDKDLRKLLDRVATASEQQRSKVLSELQEVLTAASIATDECDFGTGLELAWNILAHGTDHLNVTIEQYLSIAYSLLNRSAFSKIASAHMANRKRGTNLSML